MRDRMRLELLSEESFGRDFLREFDLVVAANCFVARRDGITVYNVEMEIRAAEACAPLDLGLREVFAGIRDVAAIPEAPYREIEAATEFLRTSGRGTWTILRNREGFHDAYMADGLGGVCTCTNANKFTARDPNDPSLTFLRTYGGVLGMPLYQRREQMRHEIQAAMFDAAAPEVGQVERKVYLNGKTYDKVEYLGRDPDHPMSGEEGFALRCTRRGVRAQTMWTDSSGWVSIFKPPLVMPPAYSDALDRDRTTSMTEIRERAAQAAYDTLVASGGAEGASTRGSKASFRISGDTYFRPLFQGEDMHPTGTTTVTFAPGSAEVASAEAVFDLGPAPGPR